MTVAVLGIVRGMGILDRAKKLAEQARGVAEQAKGLAEDAIGEVKSRTGGSDEPAEPSPPPDYGTAYVPGMLGRDAWREQGLTDPAGVLPAADRDRAGIPRSTKSEIVEEPFGMGRRWSADGQAAGLYYQVHPEHRSFEPPTGWAPVIGVEGVSAADLPDGRALVFFEAGECPVVLELVGIEDSRMDLVHAVAGQLASG